MAKRGRPTGYKLSMETREKIAKSRMGSKHTEITKNKISNAVKRESSASISIERIMSTDLESAYKAQCGKYISVYIPTDGISPGKKIRYHVALMEQKIGRKLLPGEQIHHWGDKLDNRLFLLTLCRDRAHHNQLDRVKFNLKKALEKYKNYKVDYDRDM